MRPSSTGHIFETQLFDLINIIDAELKTYTTQTLSNIEPEDDVVTCKDWRDVFFYEREKSHSKFISILFSNKECLTH